MRFCFLVLSILLTPAAAKTASNLLWMDPTPLAPTRFALFNTAIAEWEAEIAAMAGTIPDQFRVPVALTSDGAILLGGHHFVQAARNLGVESIPVEVTRDESDLTTREAIHFLRQKGWILDGSSHWKAVTTVDEVLPQIPETPEQLQEALRLHRHGLHFEASDYLHEIGDVVQVNTQHLYPGQTSYSFLTVQAKIRDWVESGELVWNDREREWALPYDRGRSAMQDRVALGVLTDQGILVLDGHHKIMAAMYLGSRRVPVRLIKDFRRLSRKASFYSEMQAKGLVFLWRHDRVRDARRPPEYFHEMLDDPNRHFAALITGKLRVKKIKRHYEVLERRGPNSALAVKINRDIPFFEWILARVLREGGFVYDATWSDAHFAKELERARQILLNAQQDKDSIMRWIALLQGDQSFYDMSNAELEHLVNDHFHNCRDLLIDRNDYF